MLLKTTITNRNTSGSNTFKKRTMTRWNPDKIHYLTRSELTRLLSVIKSKRDRALCLLAYRHVLPHRK
jgi:hypothetical protein